MKQAPTLFLRLSLIVMALLVATLCIVALPAIHSNWAREFPEIAYLRYPVLGGLSITALAFFAAIYNSFKLLGYIDKNTAFAAHSITALRNIKYCALIISTAYALAMPIIYHLAQLEDAPGLMVLGMIFIGIPFVIAIFTGVVQQLLQNVVSIKSENDLTV